MTPEIEQVVFVARYRQSIEVTWKTSLELVIKCPTCSKEETEFQSVKIGRLSVYYDLPP